MKFGAIRMSKPTPGESDLINQQFSWGTFHGQVRMAYPPKAAREPTFVCINECFNGLGQIRSQWSDNKIYEVAERYRDHTLILNDYVGIRSVAKWTQVYKMAKRLKIPNIGIQIHASWWDVERLGMLAMAEKLARIFLRGGFRVYFTEIAVYGRHRAHGTVAQMQQWQVDTLNRIYELAVKVESPVFGFIEPTRPFCWQPAFRSKETQYLWYPETLKATHLGEWYAEVSRSP